MHLAFWKIGKAVFLYQHHNSFRSSSVLKRWKLHTSQLIILIKRNVNALKLSCRYSTFVLYSPGRRKFSMVDFFKVFILSVTCVAHSIALHLLLCTTAIYWVCLFFFFYSLVLWRMHFLRALQNSIKRSSIPLSIAIAIGRTERRGCIDWPWDLSFFVVPPIGTHSYVRSLWGKKMPCSACSWQGN